MAFKGYLRVVPAARVDSRGTWVDSRGTWVPAARSIHVVPGSIHVVPGSIHVVPGSGILRPPIMGGMPPLRHGAWGLPRGEALLVHLAIRLLPTCHTVMHGDVFSHQGISKWASVSGGARGFAVQGFSGWRLLRADNPDFLHAAVSFPIFSSFELTHHHRHHHHHHHHQALNKAHTSHGNA